MTILVVSKKLVDLSSLVPESKIWIDRRSLLGNPFDLPKKDDEAQRAIVVQAFALYLYKTMKGEEPVVVAEAIAEQRNLIIASTWKKPTRKQILLEIAKLVEMFRSKKPISFICHCKEEGKEVLCHGDRLAKAIAYYAEQEF